MKSDEPKPRRGLHVNFAVNLIGAVAPIPIFILTVPVYIHHMGDARYGVLSLIWIMIGYLAFLDLGLAPATINAMARLKLDARRERAQVLISAFSINILMALIGGIAIYSIGLLLLASGKNVPVELEGEVRAAMPWIATLLPLVLLSNATIGVIEARENFLLANVLQVGSTIFGQVAPVICAVFVSNELSAIIPTAAIARLISLAISLVVVYRIEGPIRLSDFQMARARQLLGYGGWVTVSTLVTPLLNTLDQLAVGRMLGVAAVPYYSVPFSVISRTQILTGAISRALFPRLSSSEPQEATELASRALVSTGILYGGICACGILLMDPLLTIWLGAAFSAKSSTAAVILVNSIWIGSITFAPYWLLHSRQRPDLIAKLHFAQLPPFVLALYLLTPSYGLIGAAIASVFRALLDLGGQMWLSGILARCLSRLAPIASLLVAVTAIQLLAGHHWILMVVLTAGLWPVVLLLYRWQDPDGFGMLTAILFKLARRSRAA